MWNFVSLTNEITENQWCRVIRQIFFAISDLNFRHLLTPSSTVVKRWKKCKLSPMIASTQPQAKYGVMFFPEGHYCTTKLNVQ